MSPRKTSGSSNTSNGSGSGAMKQSKLDFSAGKPTASTGGALGKPAQGRTKGGAGAGAVTPVSAVPLFFSRSESGSGSGSGSGSRAASPTKNIKVDATVSLSVSHPQPQPQVKGQTLLHSWPREPTSNSNSKVRAQPTPTRTQPRRAAATTARALLEEQELEDVDEIEEVSAEEGELEEEREKERDDIESPWHTDILGGSSGAESDRESVSSVGSFGSEEERVKRGQATMETVEERVAGAGLGVRSPLPGSGLGSTTPKAKKRKITDERGEEEKEIDALEKQSVPEMFRPSNASDVQVERRVQENGGVAAKKGVDKEQEKGVGDVTVSKAPAELKVKAIKWKKYHDKLRARYGESDIPTIHGENENRIHQILRYFDNIYEYGPCVGVTRRQRWDRAQALGLDPPKEVDEILNTVEGRTMNEYVQSVFYGQV